MTEKFYDPTTAPYFDPATDKRVVLITGVGVDGLGYYTALHLYLHGFVVYVIGRTELKVRVAFEAIEKEASETKPAQAHLGSLSYIYGDLLDFATIEKAAAEFLSKEKELHILINNAGLMGVPYAVLKDDMEVQYQVNVASHFLLADRVLPALQKVADDGEVVPRVVVLSSVAHYFARKRFPAPGKVKGVVDMVTTWLRYANAKLGSILFAKKFAQLHPDILTLSMHPGVIVDTGLYSYWKTVPILKYPARASISILDLIFGLSVYEGSLASLRASMDQKLTAEKDNGKFLFTGGVEAKPSALALDQKHIDASWTENIAELESRGYHVNR